MSGPAEAQTIAQRGLTQTEAEQRLRQYGPNDPAPAHRRSKLVELLALFSNPLIIILLFAAVLSGFLGQVVDAIIIVMMVVVGICD